MHIDDILVRRKDDIPKYIDQLWVIFANFFSSPASHVDSSLNIPLNFDPVVLVTDSI